MNTSCINRRLSMRQSHAAALARKVDLQFIEDVADCTSLKASIHKTDDAQSTEAVAMRTSSPHQQTLHAPQLAQLADRPNHSSLSQPLPLTTTTESIDTFCNNKHSLLLSSFIKWSTSTANKRHWRSDQSPNRQPAKHGFTDQLSTSSFLLSSCLTS